MSSVTYDHVVKKFSEVVAVSDLSFQIEDKEFLILVVHQVAAKLLPCAVWQVWKK